MVGSLITETPRLALRLVNLVTAALMASLKTLLTAVFCTLLFTALGGLGLALATAALRDRSQRRQHRI